MLTACGTQHLRLEKAATEQGIAQAQLVRPILPDDCRAKEAHTPIYKGAELHELLIRERIALNRQNARTDRCNAFQDRYWDALEGKPTGVSPSPSSNNKY